MEKTTQTKKFGLFTTISMIVGIVIGSGIFFKTPEIIRATNGNILMGAIAFIIAAISIIFGGLTIAQYAAQDSDVGGIITYCEIGYGKTLGYLAGWFQTIIYYPALIAVIGWVSACYTLGLFGIDNLLTTGSFNPTVWYVSAFYIIVIFVLNILQTRFAGKLQSILTVVKVLALFAFAIFGIIFGNPSSIVANYSAYPTSGASVLLALVSVVFAFDGWIVAPSIAHEIKDSKKNLTKALIVAPIFITVIYLLYYIGLSSFQDVSVILEGADPLGLIASSIFGQVGMRIVYACVVCSIVGTLNGLILGYIRLPYSLAVRKELPGYQKLDKVNNKYDIPVASAIFALIVSLIYLFLHFCSIDGAIIHGMTFFAGMEVDNLPIITNYIFLILLYIPVLTKKIKTDSFAKQFIYPLIAIIGALIVVFAGFTKPNFNIYLTICIVIILAGLLIKPRKNDINK